MQDLSEQSLVVHPGSQLHTWSMHAPCPEQPEGHSATVQSTPPKPCAQWHVPFLHSPWGGAQPGTHLAVAQSMPLKPS